MPGTARRSHVMTSKAHKVKVCGVMLLLVGYGVLSSSRVLIVCYRLELGFGVVSYLGMWRASRGE